MGAKGFKGTSLSTLLIVSLMVLAILLLSAGSSSAAPEGLTPRTPIHIEGNVGFTPASGVTSGSGTENDPYIIENWVINASNAHGIWIQNTTKYFVIRNCLIENSVWDYRGIYLNTVINGRIENNTCSNTWWCGIYMFSSSNNTLSNNTCSNNGIGIYLNCSSNNNTFSNNIFSNSYLNESGILHSSSSNNTFSNNIFEGCGILIKGNTVSHFNSHVMENNTVNGKPLYYYANNTGIVVPADAGEVILVNCSNMTVENLHVSNTNVGVEIAFTENSLVKNNILSNNSPSWSYNIWLLYSSNNTLSNNTSSGNHCGICLDRSSNYNTLFNNTCSNSCHGILLQDSSSNNTLSNNTCSNNCYSGITLWNSSSSNIFFNNTCSNNFCGIRLLFSSDNNHIYHNNFVSNTFQAQDECSNYWDNNREGNYWSDWQPPDYPDADEDGIVDDPRPIAGGTNQDRYPLVMGVMRVIYYPNIIYQNVKSCIFTPGGGVWTEPILNTIGEYRTDIEGFNRGEIGVLEIVENFLVQRVEIYDSGCEPPVTLTVNEITKSVTLFHDGSPYGNETIVFDITPSKKVTVYTSIHTNDSNHGFGIKWIKLIGSADTTLPVAPTLISPANGSTTNDNTPTFDWSDVADPSGVTYTLEIVGALTKTGLTASTYTLTSAEALADGTYSWRVRAIDGAGNVGDWSTTWSLTIKTVVSPARPTCTIKLQKDGMAIDEINVGEFFDIYVGGSTGDIKEVRFSSDDSQDGNPTGEWTEWYDWNTSSGDWNAETKIKRWAFATPGYKEVWAEVKDDAGQSAKRSANISANLPAVIITSPLEITPKGPYYVGDSLTAKFTVKNVGDVSISLDVLTVGGRDPDGLVIDFEWEKGITLNPNDEHTYTGKLILPNRAGAYHFFCAYRTQYECWNPSIDLGEGLTDKDRIEDIIVLQTQYQYPLGGIIIPEEIFPREEDLLFRYTCHL